MSSRDKILNNLRAHRAPFADAQPRPESYIPVTRFAASTAEDRLARFTSEVQQRFGQVHVADNPQQAIDRVLAILDADQVVMAWENLPLPGLREAFEQRQIEIVVPHVRDNDRLAALDASEKIRVGITGASAAFATTGTLALVTGKGQGRIVSLLPLVHIALLRREALFERLEDWFANEGREALQHSSSVALITGPSSTGDIEHHRVLGAHGPKVVHIVVF